MPEEQGGGEAVDPRPYAQELERPRRMLPLPPDLFEEGPTLKAARAEAARRGQLGLPPPNEVPSRPSTNLPPAPSDGSCRAGGCSELGVTAGLCAAHLGPFVGWCRARTTFRLCPRVGSSEHLDGCCELLLGGHVVRGGRPTPLERLAAEWAVIAGRSAPVGEPTAVVRNPPAEERLERFAEAAIGYAAASRARATRDAYLSDWQDFERWCRRHDLIPIPAQEATILLYLAAQAEFRKPSTIRRRLVALRQAHLELGYSDPTDTPAVRATWRGIRNTLGVAAQPKRALATADIRTMVEALDDSLTGVRDKALLLIGFAGAFRRSELTSLDVEDLDFRPEGVAINIRRAKQDQEGEGRLVGIPTVGGPTTNPVLALQDWLEAAELEGGPVYRSIDRWGQLAERRLHPGDVPRIVKRAAAGAGLDPASYAGHSLRSGAITEARRQGASEHALMRHTGHRSLTVFRRYVQQASIWEDNPVEKLALG